MRKYLLKNPAWFSWPYRHALWRVDTQEKELFLTFDDGPTPEVTEYVVDLLARYDAQASFFCLGSQVVRYPDVMQVLSNQGHLVANHCFDHLNGWKMAKSSFVDQVEQCQQAINPYQQGSKLFRPPYGNIRFGQLSALQALGYQVVMWSHLSGDFDADVNILQSIREMRKAGAGSILVFHDSAKACKNLQQLLPPVLDHFSTLGYTFKTLDRLCN